MYGRAPKFIEEVALNADLLKRFQDGELQILRPTKLIKLPAPRTTPVTGQITAYTPHDVPYPCIIKPVNQLGPVTGGSGKLLAYLGNSPEESPATGTYAIESRGGLLRLPIPGTWWIGYDGPTDSVVHAMMFDDTCGAAQHLLSRRNVILREPGVVNVLAAAATNIVADDQYRDGIYLQNQGTVDIWIRRGDAASAPAAVGTGYQLPPGETYPLIGETAYKGPLNGRANGANANLWPVEVAS